MYLELFRMPTPVTIMGRTSSITNAFVNGVIPAIPPSESDVKEALGVLGMNEKTICCCYCGDKSSEWDHFRPLIVDKRATGYISEIQNLVPSCGKCNQSKGNKPWKSWMTGTAKKSPKSRNMGDLDSRIRKLEAFELWREPTVVDFVNALGSELWESYWDTWQRLLESMKEAQNLSSEIRAKLSDAHN